MVKIAGRARAGRVRAGRLRAGLLAGLLLPGLGSGDARVPVSVADPPWSALARVQVPGVSRCTGFFVAAGTVVTAAHCLWDGHVRRTVRPGQIHVLAGYDHGGYHAHAVARGYRVGAGYAGGANTGLGGDVAVLTLDAAIGAAALPWADAARPGEATMLGGYEQDRAETLLADTACRTMGRIADAGGRPILQHACAATGGTSGAPLLVRRDGRWAVAGVNVAASVGDVGGLAVPAATARALLP